MTQTLPAPPPGAGEAPAGDIDRLDDDMAPDVGVCVVGIVVGAGFGVAAAGIVAGIDVAAGDVLMLFAAVALVAVGAVALAPYQSFTPLWPWQAPRLLSPE